jgi:hypothetical protein
MTRRIRNDVELQLVASDAGVPAVAERAWPDYDDSQAGGARKASPYQRGDVVMVSFERDVAVKAIVLSLSADYLQRRDEWTVRYRVAPITKAGTWSKAWRAAWPGFIERGYQAAKVSACLS